LGFLKNDYIDIINKSFSIIKFGNSKKKNKRKKKINEVKKNKTVKKNKLQIYFSINLD